MKMKKEGLKKCRPLFLALGILIAAYAMPVSAKAASSVVESAISWAVAIANDNSHGYSQSNRWGPDYDCSSFVITAFKSAGVNTGAATYTGNMRGQFMQHGFRWIPWSQIGSMSNLQRGDILLNEAKHTEIYLGSGKNVGAHSNRGYPAAGDQTGTEVSVSGYYNYPWDGVLRYAGDSSVPPIGAVDSAEGRVGAVFVSGWAIDMDTPVQPLSIHVYIGGPAGSGVEGHEIKADQSRTDVANAYPGTGAKHGYSAQIKTSRTGTQQIYIYAINTGSGSNVLLGKKTVTIKPCHNPIGAIDKVVGGMNNITVSGWAFDEDAPTQSLDIHVYIGGPTGSGAEGHIIKANKNRPDVAKSISGAGSYLGYNEVLETKKTGSQAVYLYAINKGGGDNTLLGSKTVNIQSDTKAPVISNVRVTEVSRDGYTVTCKVTDNGAVDRVQFPTWTTANGQDDMDSSWVNSSKSRGTKSGDTYTFKVKASDHKQEGGEYRTDIYAYDKMGNRGFAGAPPVIVDRTAPVISQIKITDVDHTGYTVSCKVTDNCELDRVRFPSWTEANGKDDLPSDWATSVSFAGVRSGDTYTFRVKTQAHNGASGKYLTRIYAWDKQGNSVSADAGAANVPDYIHVSKVTLNTSGSQLYKGGKVTLTATVEPKNANNKNLNWSSSNPKVAAVDSRGTVTAVGGGTATITVKSADGGKTASCLVTVVLEQTEETKTGYSGSCGDGVRYLLDPNTGTLYIRGNGPMKDYATYSESPWYAFNSLIRKVVIERGVTRIGDRAFMLQMKLTSVEIGEGVTSIGNRAFSTATALEYVTLPSTLSRIEEMAFYSTAIESIRIPAQVTYIGYNALGSQGFHVGTIYGYKGSAAEKYAKEYGCKFEEITAATPAKGNGLSSDGKNGGTSQASPSNKAVGSGSSAQSSSSNKAVGSGSSAQASPSNKAVGNGSSAQASPSNRTIGSGNSAPAVKPVAENGQSQGGGQSQGSGLSQGSRPGQGDSVAIGDMGFLVTDGQSSIPAVSLTTVGNKNQKQVTVPDVITYGGTRYQVKEIADGAFCNNQYLSGVTLGKYVEKIGANAFAGCRKLSVVRGGQTVQVIEKGAFKNCGKLKVIPSFAQLKVISDSAFEGCTSLRKLNLGAKVEKIGKRAFYGCKKLKSLKIQTQKLNKKNVGKQAFGKGGKVTVQITRKKFEAYKKLLKQKGLKGSRFKKG